MSTKKGAAHTPVTDLILEDGRKGKTMVKIEIYEKNITYHSAITLEVNDADRRELERILIACGLMYRVTPIEEEVEKDDF